jgi:hypothetical protein
VAGFLVVKASAESQCRSSLAKDTIHQGLSYWQRRRAHKTSAVTQPIPHTNESHTWSEAEAWERARRAGSDHRLSSDQVVHRTSSHAHPDWWARTPKLPRALQVGDDILTRPCRRTPKPKPSSMSEPRYGPGRVGKDIACHAHRHAPCCGFEYKVSVRPRLLLPPMRRRIPSMKSRSGAGPSRRGYHTERTTASPAGRQRPDVVGRGCLC